MNLVIQMVMLAAGALILLTCKVEAGKIASTAVFKAGATAMFSIFGVAWMTETVVHAHLESLEHSLSACCPITCGCTPSSCSSSASW